MANYQYMTRNEYKNSCKKTNSIIRDVQRDLKKDFSINVHLIGSVKNRLVMKSGDSPYDFDYSLEIIKDKNKIGDASKIRQIIFDSFQKYATRNGFDKMNNDSRTIKLKKHHENIENHIDFWMEVAVIMKINKKMNIIKYIKSENRYIWNQEEDIIDFNIRFRKLRKKHWIEFKEKYKEKKDKNKENKKSISLFKETINEIEDKYDQ